MPITTRELIERINDNDTVINRCSKSNNSFGTFLFVGVYNDKTQECRTYYGAGYHEYKEIYVIDEWEDYGSRDDETLRIAKSAVIYQINKAVKIACKYQLGITPQSRNATIYSELVDAIGDEDAVLAQMEDMGLT